METLPVRAKLNELPTPSPSTTIAQALDAFKVKMMESSRRYIDLYVDRLLEVQPRNNEVALIYFGRFLWNRDQWCQDPWPTETYPITQPEEIRDILPKIDYHFALDGVYPPADEKTRQRYFLDLEKAIKEKANTSIYSEPLLVPKDYKELLALAGCISDPDYRRANVSEIVGVKPLEELRKKVRYLHVTYVGWQVAGGWQDSVGSEGDTDLNFAFCRNIDAEAPESESSWAWRIFYSVSDGIEKHPESPVVVLNGIIPFLDWYSDWWSRTKIDFSIECLLAHFSEDSKEFEEERRIEAEQQEDFENEQ